LNRWAVSQGQAKAALPVTFVADHRCRVSEEPYGSSSICHITSI